jgi:hypothetical protein
MPCLSHNCMIDELENTENIGIRDANCILKLVRHSLKYFLQCLQCDANIQKDLYI